MRPRDALGRIVEAGSPEEVPGVPELALPPREALALARSLLVGGRAFAAHEVFEAVWKACPAQEGDLWQGLAQVCVGVTHHQRGNEVGAVTLLRRGAGRLRAYDGTGLDPSLPVDPSLLADRAEALACRIEAGALIPAAALLIV